MAKLSVPATPVAQPSAASGTARTSWDREGALFLRGGAAPTSPSLRSLKPRSTRAVAWSPNKRIVSYDKAAPASTRRPMREEFLAHRGSGPANSSDGGTPTKHSTAGGPRRQLTLPSTSGNTGGDDGWQDVDEPASVPRAGPKHHVVLESEAETTATEISDLSGMSASSLFGFSPLPSTRRRGVMGGGTPARARTPRRRADDGDRSLDFSEADSSFGGPSSGAPRRRRSRWLGWLANPGTPQMLASYLQLAFNLAMLGLLLYVVYLFMSTVRSDVNMKVEEYSLEILAEIEKCANDYVRNNCQPGKRVPALETICNTWEACMNRDEKQVGRARVSAETFGQIVNSFIAPIGWKALIFLGLIFVGSFLLVNAVFASRLGPTHSQAATSGLLPQPYPVALPGTPAPATPFLLNYPGSSRGHYTTPRSSRRARH